MVKESDWVKVSVVVCLVVEQEKSSQRRVAWGGEVFRR